MTQTSYTDRQLVTLEQAAIHEAACRYRRRGLVCSTCTDTRERAARIVRATALDAAA